MNIYNITSKNEKRKLYTKMTLKCCCEKILVHILCLKHLMLSAKKRKKKNILCSGTNHSRAYASDIKNLFAD